MTSHKELLPLRRKEAAAVVAVRVQQDQEQMLTVLPGSACREQVVALGVQGRVDVSNQ